MKADIMSMASGLLSVTQDRVLNVCYNITTIFILTHYQILSTRVEVHESLHSLATSSSAVLTLLEVSPGTGGSWCYLVVVLRLLEEHAALHLLLLLPPLLSDPVRHVGLQQLVDILSALAVGGRQVHVRAGGPHRTNSLALLEIFLIVKALQSVPLLEFHFHQHLLFLKQR